MKLLSWALAFVAISGRAAVLGQQSQESDSFEGQHEGQHEGHGPGGHGAGGGPLVAACKDLEEGAKCEVSMDGRAHPPPGEEDEEDVIGICNKMLDGEMHCHILHPSQLVCLDQDEGSSCSFKHRGSKEEETGVCYKMPHGMACRREDAAPDGGDGGHGHEGAREHIERFTKACLEKSAGDACTLDMPNGMENQFGGICEEPHMHHHEQQESSSKTKPLRCRMLSPMEAACIGKTEGVACNITMHGQESSFHEEGECKQAVRGEMHCRHKPRDFGAGMNRPNALRGGRGERSGDALSKVR